MTEEIKHMRKKIKTETDNPEVTLLTAEIEKNSWSKSHSLFINSKRSEDMLPRIKDLGDRLQLCYEQKTISVNQMFILNRNIT